MENPKKENIFLKLVSNETDWMDAFRQNIGILRTYYGWSVRVLSEKADISENTLNNIIKGRTRDCDQSLTIKLAKAFHVSVDELVGGGTIDVEVRECIGLSRNLADHHRYVIRQYVRRQYKMHGALIHKDKQITIKFPECLSGRLRVTDKEEPLNIEHLRTEDKNRICLGVKIPCEHYEPHYYKDEILLLGADRDGLNGEKCMISYRGDYYLCIKKIEIINGEKKISYISLMDGHNKMFEYDEIDDKIGYVVGFLYPDGEWGER